MTPIENPIITPEAPVQMTVSRLIAGLASIAVAVAVAVFGYAKLEGRVSASEREVALRPERAQVDRLAERVEQSATKADLERMGNELREAFMGARWFCVRTREGMECAARIRRKHGKID